MKVIKFEDFENIVMQMLLKGDHPFLEILREQYKNSQVMERTFTKVGFITDYDIPQKINKIENPKNFEIGDLSGNINEVFVTFILFIREGVISFLEGAVAEGLWPKTIHHYNLVYTVQNKTNSKKFGTSNERDIEMLRKYIQTKKFNQK